MSPEDLAVYVNQLPAVADLTAGDVEHAVRAVAEGEGVRGGEISVSFVDVKGIAALGETYLGQARATDVISFNLGESDAPVGDIYVCPEVAADSASERGIGLREELLRLVVHGLLHVLGHDHPEGPEREESEMFQRQESILSHILATREGPRTR